MKPVGTFWALLTAINVGLVIVVLQLDCTSLAVALPAATACLSLLCFVGELRAGR